MIGAFTSITLLAAFAAFVIFLIVKLTTELNRH